MGGATSASAKETRSRGKVVVSICILVIALRAPKLESGGFIDGVSGPSLILSISEEDPPIKQGHLDMDNQ